MLPAIKSFFKLYSHNTGKPSIFPVLWNNILMETFGERLQQLQRELAKQLKVGKSTISLWETNQCEPTLSKFISISNYFKVSIDYLAGLEN